MPYGGRPYPGLGSEEQLRAYSAALKGAELLATDFEHVLDRAKSGDLIYLDPPYTVAHSNNGFLKYNDRIFSWSDQQRLASVARELDRRGYFVIVSNANHESIAALSAGFATHIVGDGGRAHAGHRRIADLVLPCQPRKTCWRDRYTEARNVGR